jgi:hypothetical protein
MLSIVQSNNTFIASLHIYTSMYGFKSRHIFLTKNYIDSKNTFYIYIH